MSFPSIALQLVLLILFAPSWLVSHSKSVGVQDKSVGLFEGRAVGHKLNLNGKAFGLIQDEV